MLALSLSDSVGVFYLPYNFADLFFPALHVWFSAAPDARVDRRRAHDQNEDPQTAAPAADAATRKPQ